MVYTDFEFICQIKVKHYYQELKRIDDDEYQGKVLRLNERHLNKVYYYYESFRKNIRKYYMASDTNPMDRHKIAANFMCSLLKAKVININLMIPNLPLELLLANEYLAFYVAVSIIEDYKRDKICMEDYKLDLFPRTYIDNGVDSYVQNTCKALHYIRRFEVKDIFSYANILFWIEKYTDMKLGIDIEGASQISN